MPVMFPASSISIRLAAGALERPGIRRISPVMGIRKPAPEAIFISRTVTMKSLGNPNRLGLSESDCWVLAMHTGSLS